MKKALFVLVCAAAIVFSGCTKNSENPLVGKYQGTFTTVKLNPETGAQTEGTSENKEKTVSISEGIVNKENLRLEGVIDLTKVSDGVYKFDGENSVTASIISSLISSFVRNDYFDNTIEKMVIEATFSDGKLTMKTYYKATVPVLGQEVQANIGVSTFTGTKVTE